MIKRVIFEYDNDTPTVIDVNEGDIERAIHSADITGMILLGLSKDICKEWDKLHSVRHRLHKMDNGCGDRDCKDCEYNRCAIKERANG